MTHPLVRRLGSRVALSEEETRALEALPTRTRTLGRDEDLAREGDRPEDCHVLTDGVLARYKILPDGKRQITAFLIAGDPCDLGVLASDRMDHAIGALTPARVSAIPHRALHDLSGRFPRLGAALWRETLTDGAIALEWVVNVGRRPAFQRLAHLLCEMHHRFRAAGRLSEDGSFPWPVTQADMADATGLSTVHLNRTLQELRGEGLITWAGGAVRVLDGPRLQDAAAFTPAYLSAGSVGGVGAARPAGGTGDPGADRAAAKQGVPRKERPSAGPG